MAIRQPTNQPRIRLTGLCFLKDSPASPAQSPFLRCGSGTPVRMGIGRRRLHVRTGCHWPQRPDLGLVRRRNHRLARRTAIKRPPGVGGPILETGSRWSVVARDAEGHAAAMTPLVSVSPDSQDSSCESLLAQMGASEYDAIRRAKLAFVCPSRARRTRARERPGKTGRRITALSRHTNEGPTPTQGI